MSLRLSPELEQRLEDMSRRTGIKKHTLAQMAVEAAVEAIEQNDYRIVAPIKFAVTHVPALHYQAHREQAAIAADAPASASAVQARAPVRYKLKRARRRRDDRPATPEDSQ